MQASKSGSLTYDTPTSEEKQRIAEGLKGYLPSSAVANLFRRRRLVVARGRRSEVFLVSASLWRLYQAIRLHRHPYFVGLYLGELHGGSFEPSLHVLHRLAEAAGMDVKVTVTRGGEQRFLYGHDLNTDHLAATPPTGEEKRPVLVVNRRGEGLGYGYLSRSGGKRVLKNRRDLGWYLRRGG